ncbi:hypothetical protein ACF07V_36380 [Streptomyces sp. NPDC015661]|uniref:hypothetical protein n=1 Tax=Streptomyces sp. NPDC015661 TaxID=3364961 RepID=UPI0036FD85A0
MESDIFPYDLVRTQRAWADTYAQLANVGNGSTTVLRRRLLRLSVRLWWHPYWATPAGGPAARVALREFVHTGRGEGVTGA